MSIHFLLFAVIACADMDSKTMEKHSHLERGDGDHNAQHQALATHGIVGQAHLFQGVSHT